MTIVQETQDEILFTATVLHGEGYAAVSTLRAFLGLHLVARAVLAVADAKALLGATDAACHNAGIIVQWLGDQSRDDIIAIVETPAFGAWLAQLEAALLEDPAGASRLLQTLPWLFVARLAEIAPQHGWHFVTSGNPLLAPIGVAQDLVGQHACTLQRLEREIVVDAGAGGRFTSDGSQLLPLDDTARQGIRQRCLLPFDIELFGAAAVPDLCNVGPAAPRDYRDAPASAAHEALVKGLGLLADTWPAAVTDMLGFLRGIVAIEVPGVSTFSASAPAAPGVILLTVRPDERPEMLAECLVHEVSHLKLDALANCRPMLADDGVARYHHPWRHDPRPLRGVLLGAHAFLNVEVFARHAAQELESERFAQLAARVAEEVGEALDTLSNSACLTADGTSLLARMTAVQARWAHAA